jgi:hypothetical protein
MSEHDSPLSEAEQQAVLESAPVGTWAILAVYVVLFVLGWLYFWFGIFVPRGLVS